MREKMIHVDDAISILIVSSIVILFLIINALGAY